MDASLFKRLPRLRSWSRRAGRAKPQPTTAPLPPPSARTHAARNHEHAAGMKPFYPAPGRGDEEVVGGVAVDVPERHGVEAERVPGDARRISADQLAISP